MKKIIAAIILLAWTCSLASCAQAPSDVPPSVAETEGTTEVAAPQEAAPAPKPSEPPVTRSPDEEAEDFLALF